MDRGGWRANSGKIDNVGEILDEIIEYKRAFVSEARKQVSIEEMAQTAASRLPGSSFARSLTASEDVAVIAEVKKASPSRGVIRADFDPVVIAKTYASHGASAISVLTDEKYFQGSASDLSLVRNAVNIPVLRKDFVVDAYQVYEARHLGASAVLLIVAALSAGELGDFIELCREVRVDALVEVHTEAELEVALRAEAKIIGINNRDLRTFETDLQTTMTVVKKIPSGTIVVSESGIFTRDDVLKAQDVGVDAVLIGEGLMREADMGAKLRELLGRQAA